MMETETGMEMESSADRLEALAKEYPEYDKELLTHLLDNENLRTKYSPEDIKVLFETPSGFVVFAIDSGYLYDSDSDHTGIETIRVHCINKRSADFFLWRKGFLELDSKSTAVRPDGIDDSLAKLIKKECGPGFILLVGESKYKEAVENNLGIPCRCDEAAEELMWGLRNLLYDLVPEETSEFGEQDRKYHRRKLLAFLHALDPDIKPEMIDGEMALLASIIHHCNVTNRNYRDNMHKLDNCLEKISGLKTDHWDTVTHATALMKLIGESVPTPKIMFTEDERKKMLEGVGKYGDEIDRATMRVIYKHTVQLNKVKFSKLRKLRGLLGEAKAAAREGARESEGAPQVSGPNRSGQEEEEGAEGDR